MRGRPFVVSKSEVVPTTDTEHRQQRDSCSQLPSINTPTGERPRARWTCGSATTHLDFGVRTVERCLASSSKKKKTGRLDFCSGNHALMSHETAFVCERSVQHALVYVAASPRTECSKIEKSVGEARKTKPPTRWKQFKIPSVYMWAGQPQVRNMGPESSPAKLLNKPKHLPCNNPLQQNLKQAQRVTDTSRTELLDASHFCLASRFGSAMPPVCLH